MYFTDNLLAANKVKLPQKHTQTTKLQHANSKFAMHIPFIE